MNINRLRDKFFENDWIDFNHVDCTMYNNVNFTQNEESGGKQKSNRSTYDNADDDDDDDDYNDSNKD